jgi:hypothetical protein
VFLKAVKNTFLEEGRALGGGGSHHLVFGRELYLCRNSEEPAWGGPYGRVLEHEVKMKGATFTNGGYDLARVTQQVDFQTGSVEPAPGSLPSTAIEVSVGTWITL